MVRLEIIKTVEYKTRTQLKLGYPAIIRTNIFQKLKKTKFTLLEENKLQKK